MLGLFLLVFAVVTNSSSSRQRTASTNGTSRTVTDGQGANSTEILQETQSAVDQDVERLQQQEVRRRRHHQNSTEGIRLRSVRARDHDRAEDAGSRHSRNRSDSSHLHNYTEDNSTNIRTLSTTCEESTSFFSSDASTDPRSTSRFSARAAGASADHRHRRHEAHLSNNVSSSSSAAPLQGSRHGSHAHGHMPKCNVTHNTYYYGAVVVSGGRNGDIHMQYHAPVGQARERVQHAADPQKQETFEARPEEKNATRRAGAGRNHGITGRHDGAPRASKATTVARAPGRGHQTTRPEDESVIFEYSQFKPHSASTPVPQNETFVLQRADELATTMYNDYAENDETPNHNSVPSYMWDSSTDETTSTVVESEASEKVVATSPASSTHSISSHLPAPRLVEYSSSGSSSVTSYIEPPVTDASVSSEHEPDDQGADLVLCGNDRATNGTEPSQEREAAETDQHDEQYSDLNRSGGSNVADDDFDETAKYHDDTFNGEQEAHEAEELDEEGEKLENEAEGHEYHRSDYETRHDDLLAHSLLFADATEQLEDPQSKSGPLTVSTLDLVSNRPNLRTLEATIPTSVTISWMRPPRRLVLLLRSGISPLHVGFGVTLIVVNASSVPIYTDVNSANRSASRYRIVNGAIEPYSVHTVMLLSARSTTRGRPAVVRVRFSPTVDDFVDYAAADRMEIRFSYRS